MLGSATALAAQSAPTLLAPGVISTGDDEWGFTMAADGNTVYFNKSDRGYKLQIIVESMRAGDGWSTPRVAWCSLPTARANPAAKRARISICGQSTGCTMAAGARLVIWATWLTAAPRKPTAPSPPTARCTSPASPARGQAQPVSRAPQRRRLWRAREAARADHTDDDDSNHFIAPDQSYLLFLSSRAGGHGENDLYIVFRDGDGWSAPKHLDPEINRPGTSGVFTPFVSADGKTLYYAARFAAVDALPAKSLTYDEVIGKLRSPGNGQGDLYSQPWDAGEYR